MIVYVVQSSYLMSEWEISGVFANKQSAEAYVKRQADITLDFVISPYTLIG